MTHREQTTPMERLLFTLAEDGFDGLAEAISVLLNEVMKLEGSAFLGAAPHERCDGRRFASWSMSPSWQAPARPRTIKRTERLLT